MRFPKNSGRRKPRQRRRPKGNGKLSARRANSRDYWRGLAAGADDEWKDPQRLARAYDEQGFSLKDLAVIVTLRFPEAEVLPQVMKLHDAWEAARAFTLERLVKVHGVAAVCVMHVPARAARPGAPHVHVLIPARAILATGFGKFVRPLATDEGRGVVDAEWAAWRESSNVS